MTDTTQTDVKISVLDKEQLETAFKALCSQMGLRSACVEVEKYDFADRDRYFTNHEDVWERINGDECGFEDIEYDRERWFRDDFPSIPDDFPITEELYDLLNREGYIDDEDIWTTEDGELRCDLVDKTYANASPGVKADLDAYWEDLTLDTVSENRVIMDALDLSEDSIEEKYGISNAMDTLAYWTIYYEPWVQDEDAAWRSGLFPFKYEGKFLLALGGCGMDLSPKLDCYQALTRGTIDRGSTLFSQVSYFDYVSHVKSNEILKKVELAEPKVVFTSYGKKPTQ
jgi:hypothetical protein